MVSWQDFVMGSLHRIARTRLRVCRVYPVVTTAEAYTLPAFQIEAPLNVSAFYSARGVGPGRYLSTHWRSCYAAIVFLVC